MGMEIVDFGEGRGPSPSDAKVIFIYRVKSSNPKRRTHCRDRLTSALSGTSLSEVIAHLEKSGVFVIEGPVPRTGATG